MTAVSTTTAGCLGGDSGSEQQGENPSNGADDSQQGETTVEALCAQIPGESTAYDAGETAMICDFDIPTAFADEFGPFAPDQTAGAAHRHRLRSEVTEYGELMLQVQISTDEESVAVEERFSPPPDRESYLDVEFSGETVGMYRTPPDVREAMPELTQLKCSHSIRRFHTR
jgi:hypothetical protein